MKTSSLRYTLLILLLAFCAPLAQAASALVDQIYNVRQSTSGGFKEVRYDLKQWYIYDNGAPARLVQTITNTGYANDGGYYGSSQNKQLYAAKLKWMQWANGQLIIPANNRPFWLPVADSAFQPFNRITDGQWWYRVSSSSGSTTTGSTLLKKLVDRQLLTDVMRAIGHSGSLSDYDWSSLKRLSGNQIRLLFSTLGTKAAAATQNAGIAGPLSDLGEQMALLLEDQLKERTTTTASGMSALAKKLRGRSDFARKRSVEIADIYARLFDAAVSPEMINQVAGFSSDYERTLRRTEGNWTTYSPSWNRSQGTLLFDDLLTSTGQKLTYDETAFPWVKITSRNTWIWIQQDNDAEGQIIWHDTRKANFYMQPTYQQGVRVGTKWWIWNASKSRWETTVNPFG